MSSIGKGIEQRLPFMGPAEAKRDDSKGIALSASRKIDPEEQKKLDVQLFNAIIYGDDDVKGVESAINRGANVNSIDTPSDDPSDNPEVCFLSDTPLMVASGLGHIKVVNFLIKHGADVNWMAKSVHYYYSSSHNALMLAATKGFVCVTKALVDAKANVNERQESGDTALTLAATYGFVGVTKALVDVKANINEQNESGKTALMLAASDRMREIIIPEHLVGKVKFGERADHIGLIKYLLRSGANANVEDLSGNSILTHAVDCEDKEVIKTILETSFKNLEIPDHLYSNELFIEVLKETGIIEQLQNLIIQKLDYVSHFPLSSDVLSLVSECTPSLYSKENIEFLQKYARMYHDKDSKSHQSGTDSKGS